MSLHLSVPLVLPERTEKPRVFGLTSTHEVGCPVGELRSILHDYHSYIDIAKLGIGSAYVTPNLHEKLSAYAEYGVNVCFGGTLFEKFYHRSTVTEYRRYLRTAGVDWVEVSTGTLSIPLSRRVEIVQELREDLMVVSEVGVKDPERGMPPAQWVDEIHALLEAGSAYVILEGRSSGTVGLYTPAGKLKEDLLTEILGAVDPRHLIFEAPHPSMQMVLMNRVGPNVNLGNVSPRDLLLVEAQRCGLRSETFFINDQTPSAAVHSSGAGSIAELWTQP